MTTDDTTASQLPVPGRAPTAASLPPAPTPPPATPPAATPAEPGAVMSLVDHLSELRGRLIWSIAAVAVGTLIGFALSERIIAVLRYPLPADLPLVVTSIGDPFAIRIRIALVAGIILAMPVLLWQVWRFVAPGLTATERRAILPWIPAALAFFLLGVGVAYVVLPFAPSFLLSELTAAFRIGFLLYLGFIVVDMVIANVLLAMGLSQVTPTNVAIPFKLLLFVTLDGWSRLVHGLVLTYR